MVLTNPYLIYLSSILTDAEKAVVQTMTMKLLPTPAVRYLKEVGFKMSRATYFRYEKS